MKSISELDGVIARGNQAFYVFIEQELRNDKDLLKRRFSLKNGEKTTVLNYLIRIHNRSKGWDMSEPIRWLLERGADINKDQPLHLLMWLRKMDLYSIFVNERYLPQDRELSDYASSLDTSPEQQLQLHCRDNEGRTLLSRAIGTRDNRLISELVRLELDLDEASKIKVSGEYIELQPLHQAVLSNYPEAIQLFINARAEVNNPCGPKFETPLILAARYGRIDALAALLACSDKELDYSYENKDGMRAIDFLCQRLQDGVDSEETLQGIAMLLCHGAEAPLSEEYRSLLMDNRIALLDEVKKYTKASQYPATQFVRACHDKNNSLHKIIYASSSWAESFRRTFGFSSKESFLVEELVFNVNELPKRRASLLMRSSGLETSQQESPSVSHNQSESFTPKERQFAEFVWRYRGSFQGFFVNPFSKMHWKLATGEYTTIKQVSDYVKENHQEEHEKKIRSELIWERMTKGNLIIHDRLDENYEDGARLNYS
ncbi:Ankyrin repeats (3 copies) [Legionella massiliensis]|uniref:Ankyrin repeats (3 copies) n=1 Tax=Legionella massiliensis TaxID=1034943 RepID=A0A078KUN8_9GAMM|nr:Dot/Icm T4SS effector AnkC/LegA12 [Legionella massiliensis]CDZ76761.1 Ankyrin repeats (3 copies) [Legionella massiliensis]CEE12499.1 Ankyrin repeats (3 copies) [Legionella massiliensis]